MVDNLEAVINVLEDSTTTSAFVIWSDELNPGETDGLAEAVRASGKRCIEVRAERWDGRTPSPLSAACTGVISGFGANGVRAAITLLSTER